MQARRAEGCLSCRSQYRAETKTGTGTSQKGSQSPSFIALPKKTGFERVTPVGGPPQKRARVIGAATGRWKAGETGGRTRDAATGSALPHLGGQVARREDASLGDDAGDQLGRRHVEGGVQHLHALRRDRRFAPHVGHFSGVALLDRNLVTRGGRQIHGGAGRRYIERNAV